VYPSSREGPLWLGNLNSDIAQKLDYTEDPDKQFLSTIERLKTNDLSLYFADIADFARISGKDTKSIESSMLKLRDAGIECGRSMFSNTGIKVSSTVPEAFNIIY
jgi:tRNA G26 N,N-dimethylase Trm1